MRFKNIKYMQFNVRFLKYVTMLIYLVIGAIAN